MTFKDLQKVIEIESGYTKAAESNQILVRLKGKPFWYWEDSYKHKQSDIKYKGPCCFNHIISLPKKNGKDYPLFDYEKLLHRALLVPGYFNSNPKLHTHDPSNIMYPFKEKH